MNDFIGAPSLVRDKVDYDIWALHIDDRPGIFMKTVNEHPGKIQDVMKNILKKESVSGGFFSECHLIALKCNTTQQKGDER